MERLFRICFIILICPVIARCQISEHYPIAKASKITKPTALRDASQSYLFMGTKGNLLSFLARDLEGHSSVYNYNIETGLFEKDRFIQVDRKPKIADAIRRDSLLVFIGIKNAPGKFKKLGFTEIPVEDFEYQDLWLSIGGRDVFIDKLAEHIIDRKYQITISSDGKYITCNPYSSRSAGYDRSRENFFFIYDISDLSKIIKTKIPCERCLKSVIVDDKMFFEMELAVGGGFDDYYSNIYMSPKNNIADTTLVSSDTKIIHVDPDHNIIVGSKKLFGRNALVVIDIKTKKFEYVLGRDYLSRPIYFARDGRLLFDFGDSLISVYYARKFPLDALLRYPGRSTIEENEVFWNKYSIVD